MHFPGCSSDFHGLLGLFHGVPTPNRVDLRRDFRPETQVGRDPCHRGAVRQVPLSLVALQALGEEASQGVEARGLEDLQANRVELSQI